MTASGQENSDSEPQQEKKEKKSKSKKKDVDEIFKPKRKFPGFRKNVVEYFAEFSSNTGIHGFKYMGEQDRTIFEKLYWLVLFLISLYICIYLIIQTYIKWELSPVLVSFARSPTPVWQVPFPAVTICPETKAKQRMYNFTDGWHQFLANNMSQEELEKFASVSLVCDNHLVRTGNKTTDFGTVEFLRNIAPKFEDMVWQCKWTNLNESCYHFFVPTLTEEGVCFTFNMLDRNELMTNAVYLHGDFLSHSQNSEGWTLENGYPKTASKDTFPRRALSAGADAGLFLLLTAFEQDLDYVCKGPVQGFKILLHHPAEVPKISSQYFRAPLNQEVIVAIKPDMMTTSEGLQDYDPHRRQCYFPKERHLYFYQSYTQTNCEIECLTNYTRQRCGCVAYHMPHEEATEICGAGSVACMIQAKTELLAREINAGLEKYEETGEDQMIKDCDCLPACTSLTYNAETSQADFNWEKMLEAFRENKSEFPGIQMTRIGLFFKEMQFITSERNELYGQTDFLANCGGLLGLFTGFSFLSTVEIVYFLSLRLLCNIKKHGRHFWSGSPELLANDAYLHTKE